MPSRERGERMKMTKGWKMDDGNLSVKITDRGRQFLRRGAFFGILLAGLVLPGIIMTPEKMIKYGLAMGRNRVFSEIGNQEKESIDVLVLGDSESYTSFSPLQAWGVHGFTAYNGGISGGTILESESVLGETLKKQSPRLVLLETHCLFYGNNGKHKTSHLTERLYNMFPLLRNHNGWKSTFRRVGKSSFKGFHINGTVKPVNALLLGKKKSTKISEINLESLQAMKKKCEERGAKLVLYSAPSPKCYTPERTGVLRKVAETMGLSYIDLNSRTREMCIDWTMDTRDHGDHLNISGGQKSTAYLGDWLVKNYDLPDRRQSRLAKKWNRDYQHYVEVTGRAMQRVLIAKELKRVNDFGFPE